ncbi:MAG: hydrogenase [Candidatus Eisenbacteria bacterium]|uniref:Hydrogenase n=1 Tax=Eiseniibacteriota bacterium TaxID=2212470 RepID=A0A9D6QM86_UNCEI|nr:hydrogenase [Candidatus Eisenbacteria bacterium]MBI3539498.1 hydrogenase [Candidatus Eisenbacteria bacterium]
MLAAIVVLPVAGALGAWFDRDPGRRTVWLLGGALAHLSLVALAWRFGPGAPGFGWLAFDPLGGLVLTLVSVVFVAVACYAVGYLRREAPRGGHAFVSCMLAFLASASLVALTRHFGVLWVGMEATTLATAPLIYDPTDRRSLEAVWKYLMICSVGIALALLGTFFLATAQLAGSGGPTTLMLPDLIANAHGLHPAWLRAAFVFLLIGFGTKMGLAPMHTWLPDAHGEAPSPISALLSGALLNAAFLAVLRGFQVVHAAGLADFARPLLIGFGVLSLVVAAAFLLGQENYKRMLAYSSVEQMGLLAIGVGLSGVAAYGALLQMLGASLAKAMLFLAAGNILIGFGTKQTAEVTGLLKRLPVTGTLFVVGLFAITGSPPFAVFPGQVVMLTGAVHAGRLWIALVMVVLEATVFMAMGASMLGMVLGAANAAPRPSPEREDRWLIAPPLALMLLILLLGLYVPAGLHQALAAAAATLGGGAP